MRPLVVFIHGLNTYGDGLVHIGPLTFGGMKDRWEAAMRKQGFDFIGVRGIGYGKIEEQADCALASLAGEGFFEAPRDLVLIGHSLGGLVARTLATRSEIRAHVKKIITFGTPHGGAHVTDVALSLEEKAPLLNTALKKFGYDVGARREVFMNFTRASLDAFNASHPLPPNVRCFSLLCEVRGTEISWPLVPVHARLKAMVDDPLGDGFILSEAQKWGQVEGPFAVDHFGEMGYFFHLSRANRTRAKKEFARLTAKAAELAAE